MTIHRPVFFAIQKLLKIHIMKGVISIRYILQLAGIIVLGILISCSGKKSRKADQESIKIEKEAEGLHD